MANTVKIKRSAVPGKVPLTTDVQLGELAINSYDGKLFLKKNVSGVEAIVDLTASGLQFSGAAANATLVAGPGITLSYNSSTNVITASAKGLTWASTAL